MLLLCISTKISHVTKYFWDSRHGTVLASSRVLYSSIWITCITILLLLHYSLILGQLYEILYSAVYTILFGFLLNATGEKVVGV